MMCPHCSREWLTQAERAEHIRTAHANTPGDGGPQTPALDTTPKDYQERLADEASDFDPPEPD
jgi:hypothetical protein